MSKMMRILKSTDSESKQRQVTRLKKELVQLTEDIQLIELTLDNAN
jgi:hypothetical protein